MIELVGQTLGQYRIDELIGLGGMARVYKGYQAALDRFVAIKAIPVQGEGAQERTRRGWWPS
jgi:serine/threonine protein kinase